MQLKDFEEIMNAEDKKQIMKGRKMKNQKQISKRLPKSLNLDQWKVPDSLNHLKLHNFSHFGDTSKWK